jgi:hypothetical protein
MQAYDQVTTRRIREAAASACRFMVSEDLIEFNFKRVSRNKIEVRARATGSMLAVVAVLDEPPRPDLMDDCA